MMRVRSRERLEQLLRDFLIVSETVGAQVNLGGSLRFSETLSRHMKWEYQGSKSSPPHTHTHAALV